MTSQAAVSVKEPHYVKCVKCARSFVAQARNVTFHRSADRKEVWFEARCLHCGVPNKMSCADAKEALHPETLTRAFRQYEKDHEKEVWENPLWGSSSPAPMFIGTGFLVLDAL